jgi:hypothetical protein
MIFAITDFLQYRLQTGRYSPRRLQEQGGTLAVSSNFSAPGVLEPGNLFLLHTRVSLASWVIMYMTSDAWSHGGFIVQGGQVIDATPVGIRKHPFSDYLDGRSYIAIVAVPTTPDRLQEASDFAEATVGQPYSWGMMFARGLMILFGRSADYRPRISIDLILTLGVLTALSFSWPTSIAALALFAVPYILVVMLNCPERRRARSEPWSAWATVAWRQFRAP